MERRLASPLTTSPRRRRKSSFLRARRSNSLVFDDFDLPRALSVPSLILDSSEPMHSSGSQLVSSNDKTSTTTSSNNNNKNTKHKPNNNAVHHKRRSTWLRKSYDQLLRQGKFQRIADILRDTDADVVRTWLWQSCQKHQETPLHLVVRHRPPAHVVGLVAHRTGKHSADNNNGNTTNDTKPPELVEDSQGRTPLHVAAATACHVTVLERLLDGPLCAMPAIAKDHEGRCALHWACLSYDAATVTQQLALTESSQKQRPSSPLRLLFRRAASHTTIDTTSSSSFLSGLALSPRRKSHNHHHPSSGSSNLTHVLDNVRLLVQRYPEAVTVRDCHGYTPHDLAKQVGAGRSLLKWVVDSQQQQQQQQQQQPQQAQSPNPQSSGKKKLTSSQNIRKMQVEHTTSTEKDDDLSSLGWEDAQDGTSDPVKKALAALKQQPRAAPASIKRPTGTLSRSIHRDDMFFL